MMSIFTDKIKTCGPEQGSDSGPITLFEMVASEDILLLPPFIPIVSAKASEKCAWAL